MQFIGMSMYNQFGYLMDLKYFDEGYTIGNGGTPEGTLLDAEVLSTRRILTATMLSTDITTKITFILPW